MIVRAVIVGILIVAFAAPVFADQKSRGVDRREHRQKERIKQGVKTGELTKEEAKGLMQEQREIRAKERDEVGRYLHERRAEGTPAGPERSQQEHSGAEARRADAVSPPERPPSH